jgi:protocatechuate 3,4-dioxygenase alpha subunit
VPGPGGHQQAPHLAVSVFARGMLNRCVTRVYFGDEQEANDEDPVLLHVPVERRSTLIAQLSGDGSYRFDIRLQGEDETVFFAV